MNKIRVSEPLPLDGAKNVRDLGGYPAKDGRMTASRVFLRADGLQNLTDGDIRKLTDYGVCRIIDLRSDREREMMPDRTGSIPSYHVGLLDQMNSEGFLGNGPDSMFQSKQEDMERTIRYFHQRYTDAENYLIHYCHCSREDVEMIRSRLLDLSISGKKTD